MHVRRLLDYLERNLPGPLAPEEIEDADRLRAAVRAGRPLPGDWLALALDMLHETGGPSRGWAALLTI